MELISTVESKLHHLFGLSPGQLDRVMATAVGNLHKQGAFCDVYLEAGQSQSLVWDQGGLKSTEMSVVNGAGIRVVVGDKTGFWSTDRVNITNLVKAAKKAREIASWATGELPPGALGQMRQSDAPPHDLYPVENSLIDIELAAKIGVLSSIDAAARAVDPRIKNVTVNLGISESTILIATSLGDVFQDIRPLIRLSISCLAEDGTRREIGTSGGGGRYEFELIESDDMWLRHARKAAEDAVALLSAEPAQAGEMTVVLGNGWPGVLIHEAVGHGLEGDFNRKGSSAFAKSMGEKVASPLCTIVDNGTLPGRRGSLNRDDEGTPTQETVLIENGILKGYLQDRQNATLMGTAMTGNGRRESYRHAPMPRMTNTFMAGGQSSPEEIIASVKHGIYATDFGGGQVDITNGNFTFSAKVAFLIENGKIKGAVKGATLIGNGPKALHNVSMVGNDVALDQGIGTCGKSGQGVPVCVGMPTVRIDRVTVGGTR